MNNYKEEAFDGVYEEFFAYLDGNAPRPDLSTLPAETAAELESIEIFERAGRNVDPEMIPDFESDPVAIRLGLRSGAAEQRVSGGALTDAVDVSGTVRQGTGRPRDGSGHYRYAFRHSRT